MLDLSIPSRKLESMYSGRVRSVHAWARDGRSVRFPIQILRPFICHNGIHGTFALSLNAQNRLQEITRLSFNEP